MRVTIHLRDGANLTNARAETLGMALESSGVSVDWLSRADAPKDSDLVIQTGFGASRALMTQIDLRKPYLVVEAPFWRDFYDVHTASSWGYNGLAGGAWAPPPPNEERPKPELLPMKEDVSETLIIGQKPTDHSLRGSDHVQWILDVTAELPDATFRPHPLMVPPNTLEPIYEVLKRAGKVVTYTSTVGAEALVAGCQVRADHRSSLAHGVTCRETWHHDLSWRQASHAEWGDLIDFILGGYEEARERASQGLMEIPRSRVDGPSICARYYQAIKEI